MKWNLSIPEMTKMKMMKNPARVLFCMECRKNTIFVKRFHRTDYKYFCRSCDCIEYPQSERLANFTGLLKSA